MSGVRTEVTEDQTELVDRRQFIVHQTGHGHHIILSF